MSAPVHELKCWPQRHDGHPKTDPAAAFERILAASQGVRRA